MSSHHHREAALHLAGWLHPPQCRDQLANHPRPFHKIHKSAKGRHKKNLGKSGQADRFGGASGVHPSPSLTASICENFDPFLSYIKRQNNPKYGNLSRNFTFTWPLQGRGEGGQPKGQPGRFFPVFCCWIFPLARRSSMTLKGLQT